MCDKCRWFNNIDHFINTGEFYAYAATEEGIESRVYNGITYPKYNLGITEYNDVEKKAVTLFLSSLERVPMPEGRRDVVRVAYERLSSPYSDYVIKMGDRLMTGRYFTDNVRLCEKCGKIEVNHEHTDTWAEYSTSRNSLYVKHYICSDCLQGLPHCGQCNHIIFSGDSSMQVHADRQNPENEITVCRSCYLRGTFQRCTDCNTVYDLTAFDFTSVMDEDGGSNDYCPQCSETHIHGVCNNCGVSLSWDGEEIDGHTYCMGCARHMAANRMGELHEYNYTPDLVMEGPEDSLFIGFELEIDNGPKKAELVKKIYEIDHTFFYCKGDGSLNNGIEIVSHPKTMEQWETAAPILKKILNLCSNYGWQSHDCNTCGLHFHFSRNGIRKLAEGFRCLSNGIIEKIDNSDAAIMRMIYLYEKYRTAFIIFARRGSEAERWAASWNDSIMVPLDRILGDKNTTDRIKARAGSRNQRYRAVNICPPETVEFRIFRGSLITETLFASMQLSDNVVKLCCAKSNEEIQNVTFKDIVEFIHYDTLTEFATERGVI